jgi:hypothetical protein
MIKVAPGKSYSTPVVESEEEDEDKEGLEEVKVGQQGADGSAA